MTCNDIILMAKEAGFHLFHYSDKDPLLCEAWGDEIHLQRFAALVAAAEREACATVCDGKVDAEYATGKVDHNEMSWSQACAIAIRDRGQHV